MIETIDNLFSKTLKLSPDLWLYILLAVVAVAFIVTLVAGLLCGDFRKIKARMRGVVASPEKTVAEMKMMPMSVKKQYKTARLANARPSDLLSQRDLVESPYAASLISKVWIVTFVTTVICSLIAFLVANLALATVTDGAGLEHSQNIMPIVVLLVGGVLTLVGAIVGRVSYNGAVKLYSEFVLAVDGDSKSAAANVQTEANAYAEQPEAREQNVEQPYAEEARDGEVYTEQVAEPYVQQEVYAEQQAAPDDLAAREEEAARMRAEQEARAAAEQQQRAAQLEAERQAAAARAAAEQQQRAAQLEAERRAARAQSAPSGSSSADDVIARIEKIDREGAPRETMREVATLLQKERAKPENKTPEQQKKLNEALSKLLKAMSAASRK